MNFNEYKELSKRTCANIGTKEQDDLHMIEGLLTELGEICDVFKKNLAYKKDIDWINVGEELGDASWYASNMARMNDIDIDLNQWEYEDKLYTNDELIFEMLAEINKLYMLFKNYYSNAIKQPVCQKLYNLMRIFCENNSLRYEMILDRNIEKLKVRYPDKFDEEHALNRDLEKERKILEG